MTWTHFTILVGIIALIAIGVATPTDLAPCTALHSFSTCFSAVNP